MYFHVSGMLRGESSYIHEICRIQTKQAHSKLLFNKNNTIIIRVHLVTQWYSA